MRPSWLLLAVLVTSAAAAQDSRSDYLRMFDSDGDGQVSESEYLAYLSRGFASMDSNGDGVIDRSELPGGRGEPITAGENRSNLSRQFHRLDSNHDGHLNARELTAPPR